MVAAVGESLSLMSFDWCLLFNSTEAGSLILEGLLRSKEEGGEEGTMAGDLGDEGEGTTAVDGDKEGEINSSVEPGTTAVGGDAVDSSSLSFSGLWVLLRRRDVSVEVVVVISGLEFEVVGVISGLKFEVVVGTNVGSGIEDGMVGWVGFGAGDWVGDWIESGFVSWVDGTFRDASMDVVDVGAPDGMVIIIGVVAGMRRRRMMVAFCC